MQPPAAPSGLAVSRVLFPWLQPDETEHEPFWTQIVLVQTLQLFWHQVVPCVHRKARRGTVDVNVYQLYSSKYHC